MRRLCGLAVKPSAAALELDGSEAHYSEFARYR